MLKYGPRVMRVMFGCHFVPNEEELSSHHKMCEALKILRGSVFKLGRTAGGLVSKVVNAKASFAAASLREQRRFGPEI